MSKKSKGDSGQYVKKHMNDGSINPDWQRVHDPNNAPPRPNPPTWGETKHHSNLGWGGKGTTAPKK